MLLEFNETDANLNRAFYLLTNLDIGFSICLCEARLLQLLQ